MPDSTHSIRLRAAWTDRSSSPPSPNSPRLSRSAELVRHRFARRFGRPTGLTSADQLWLSLEASPAASWPALDVQVWLNGESLNDGQFVDARCRWLITDRVTARNEIWIDLSCAARDGDYDGETPPGLADVRLEIVSPDAA